MYFFNLTINLRHTTFVMQKNLPDIPQENHKTGINKFLVELCEHAVGDQNAAEDEE